MRYFCIESHLLKRSRLRFGFFSFTNKLIRDFRLHTDVQRLAKPLPQQRRRRRGQGVPGQWNLRNFIPNVMGLNLVCVGTFWPFGIDSETVAKKWWGQHTRNKFNTELFPFRFRLDEFFDCACYTRKVEDANDAVRCGKGSEEEGKSRVYDWSVPMELREV